MRKLRKWINGLSIEATGGYALWVMLCILLVLLEGAFQMGSLIAKGIVYLIN